MEPFPPLMLVPPITTAAIALSSKPVPRIGLAMLRRIMYMIAASPTMPPQKVKAATLKKTGLWPERRTASSLFPMA